MAILWATVSTTANAAIFEYVADCGGSCWDPSGVPIVGADPGLSGFLEIDDQFVSPLSGVNAGQVTDYRFEHANGGIYEFATGYDIEFENIGFNANANGFQYLDQGQASHSFPIGYIYLRQGSLDDAWVALSFKYSTRQPDVVSWSLGTYNQSVGLLLDGGNGPPFAFSSVPVPPSALLLLTTFVPLLRRRTLGLDGRKG